MRTPAAMKVFGPIAHMKEARDSLGSPATLSAAIVATGIDALFVLLDGGEVEIEGKRVAIYRPEDCLPVAPMKAAYNLAYGQCHPSSATYRLVPVDSPDDGGE